MRSDQPPARLDTGANCSATSEDFDACEICRALKRAVVDDASATELMACAAGLSDIGIGGRTTMKMHSRCQFAVRAVSSGSSIRGAMAVADGMVV